MKQVFRFDPKEIGQLLMQKLWDDKKVTHSKVKYTLNYDFFDFSIDIVVEKRDD